MRLQEGTFHKARLQKQIKKITLSLLCTEIKAETAIGSPRRRFRLRQSSQDKARADLLRSLHRGQVKFTEFRSHSSGWVRTR